ncbi:hypothetical protein OYC64_019408 [Pagothenia borchgrevinki]|uniref:Uncharacterized protein n=1 Tax=Pagothenia borchgrevinki TaxID=8213 RepID=A0ABD2FJR4_PAGBO
MCPLFFMSLLHQHVSPLLHVSSSSTCVPSSSCLFYINMCPLFFMSLLHQHVSPLLHVSSTSTCVENQHFGNRAETEGIMGCCNDLFGVSANQRQALDISETCDILMKDSMIGDL